MMLFILVTAILATGIQAADFTSTMATNFKYICPVGKVIAQMDSEKSLQYFGPPFYYDPSLLRIDRIFAITCAVRPVSTQCYWFPWGNNYGGNGIDYFCHENAIRSVVTGVDSTYYNNDRTFRYQCCKLAIGANFDPRRCDWTAWLNDYGADVNYNSGALKGLVGVDTEYSSTNNDRRFRYYECEWLHCSVTDITIKENITQTLTGSRVVGQSASQGCQDKLSYTLSLTNTDSVDETTSIEVGTSSELNWAASVTASMEVGITGIGSVSFAATATVGGSVTASTSRTKATSVGLSSSSGNSQTYNGPSAGLILGTVRRYEISEPSVLVEVKSTCQEGLTFTQDKQMAITGTRYGFTFFPQRNARITVLANCNTTSENCLHNINMQHALQKDAVFAEFAACYDAIATVAKK